MSDPSCPLAEWRAPPPPGPDRLEGRTVVLDRLSVDQVPDLFAANKVADRIWDHLPYGPFQTEAEYAGWVSEMAVSADPYFYAITPRDSGQTQGIASYLRITPEVGVIEIGHINLSAPLQRTVAASEALITMIRWAFESGYRRVEWKCDAKNLGSRRAAQRLGLSYEGIFRQATIVKDRNRDTAWFAAIDAEWEALKNAYDQWLSPDNFDRSGQQRRSLSALTETIRVSSDPRLEP